MPSPSQYGFRTYQRRKPFKPCFYCNGLGFIEDQYDFEEICPICGGRGKLVDMGGEPCIEEVEFSRN